MIDVSEARIFLVHDFVGGFYEESRLITNAIARLGLSKTTLHFETRHAAAKKLDAGLSETEKVNIAVLAKDLNEEPMHVLAEKLKRSIVGIPILGLYSNFPLRLSDTYIEPDKMPDALVQSIEYWASVDFKALEYYPD